MTDRRLSAPVAPIVKYNTVRYNLTPIVEGPFVGYGPEVDLAWDRIANDREYHNQLAVCAYEADGVEILTSIRSW